MAKGENTRNLKSWQSRLPLDAEIENHGYVYEGRLYVNLTGLLGWGVNQYINSALIHNKVEAHVRRIRKAMDMFEFEPKAFKDKREPGETRRTGLNITLYEINVILEIVRVFKELTETSRRFIDTSNYEKLCKAFEILTETKNNFEKTRKIRKEPK